MTKKFIAGNWKMNANQTFTSGLTGKLVDFIATSAPDADIAIFPPFPYLVSAIEMNKNSNLLVGGQDCHVAESGAYTGDVSATMLADIGCDYVILGHSERRAGYCETSELVKQKAEAALVAGLTPIICVGESLEERESGNAIEVVLEQVRESIPTDSTNYLLAYEPVWAIGTGKVAENADILAMHTAIAGEIGSDIRILYGGSVKPANAAEILATEHVGGVLVGGASLKFEDFIAIIEATR